MAQRGEPANDSNERRDPASRKLRQVRFRPPPGATEVLLVRHGESEAADPGEPFPLVDGHGDPALHPDGHQQAARIADRLAGESLAAIYVTPLRRTAETAAPLANRLGITPVVDADLREVYLGEWEGGRYRSFVTVHHPLAVRLLAEERWDVVPGAEAAEAFAERVRRGLTRIALRHPGEVVAVFTHGGVIAQALAEATRSRPFAFLGADNGSVSQLVIDGERWILRRFNDTAHLHPGFSTLPEPLT